MVFERVLGLSIVNWRIPVWERTAGEQRKGAGGLDAELCRAVACFGSG